MSDILNRFFPGKHVDRDHLQQELSDEFLAAMLLRGGDTPETVVERFVGQYSPLLQYLGEDRQDQILKRAQDEAHVDLSQWINQ